MFSPLHPPAKLHYVPIVQCNVRHSAGVQMSYILLPYLSKINTYSYDRRRNLSLI